MLGRCVHVPYQGGVALHLELLQKVVERALVGERRGGAHRLRGATEAPSSEELSHTGARRPVSGAQRV
eukprot:6366098-Prymnesium_polylepis.1